MNTSRHEPLPRALPRAMAPLSDLRARAEALRGMLDAPDWTVPASVAQRGRRLLADIAQIHGDDADGMPPIGGCDDALLDARWAQLEGDVQDYLDYRRWCSHAHVRGSADDRRIAWETACLVEASALLHRQEVRARGYARVAPLGEPLRVC